MAHIFYFHILSISVWAKKIAGIVSLFNVAKRFFERSTQMHTSSLLRILRDHMACL